MKYFTKEHEWIEKKNDTVYRLGITAYATEELGEIVYLDPKEAGLSILAGDEVASVESVKTISGIYAPFDAEIVASNQTVIDSPELINESPEDRAWIVELKPNKALDLSLYLTKESYDAYLTQLS